MWKQLFPPLQWLKGYRSPAFGSDVGAGLTLAAYGIPVSMAYATLAGLPPQYGIYGYLVGGLFYAVLGTGKQLAIGPTSAISLLVGTTISGMAQGDVQHWADIASLTAFVFALIAILAYLLRLSGIINFISESVLVGFKAGAGLTIGLTQLPKMFGVSGGGESFFDRVQVLISQLPEMQISVLLFGLGAFAFIFAGEKWFPGKPIAIVVVILSILLMTYSTIGSLGISVVGEIPSGLPAFHMPSLRIQDVDGVIPLALACFLLSYIESVSAGKALAQKNGYEIDPRQELLALGVANAATAMAQGYPVAGGLSQSSVNNAAGAKTPMSLVFASISIALCLLFLTGYLQQLPNVILAAIVFTAILGLFDVKEFVHLFRVSKTEFLVATIALLAVIVFGILKGVLLAAIASIVLLIKSTSDPYVAFLGRIPGTNRYSDMTRHPDNEAIPGLLIIRIESAILYYNVENIYANILAKVDQAHPPYQMVLMDLNSSPYVDVAGARFFKKLFHALESRGVRLRIAEARSEVREILRAEKLEPMLGPITRFQSVDHLVREFQGRPYEEEEEDETSRH